MFIDSGKVTSTQGKEITFITAWEELKKEAAWEEWENLIAPILRRNKQDWKKKRIRTVNS